MYYDNRRLILDNVYIKNIDYETICEIIQFDDIIPDGIEKPLFNIIQTIDKEEYKYKTIQPKYAEYERKKYLLSEKGDVEFYKRILHKRYDWRPKNFYKRDDFAFLHGEEDIKQACEFIIKYPKYKYFIKSVGYYTKDYNLDNILEDAKEGYYYDNINDSNLIYEEPFEDFLKNYIKENKLKI